MNLPMERARIYLDGHGRIAPRNGGNTEERKKLKGFNKDNKIKPNSIHIFKRKSITSALEKYKNIEIVTTLDKGKSKNVIIEPSKNHKKEEIKVAKWLIKKFGGQIKIMNEREGMKTPDFLWNGESWELKTLSTSSVNGINDNIKKAIKQIESYKPAGGIIVDITSVKLDKDKILDTALYRFNRSGKSNYILILRENDKYNIFKKISD